MVLSPVASVGRKKARSRDVTTMPTSNEKRVHHPIAAINPTDLVKAMEPSTFQIPIVLCSCHGTIGCGKRGNGERGSFKVNGGALVLTSLRIEQWQNSPIQAPETSLVPDAWTCAKDHGVVIVEEREGRER